MPELIARRLAAAALLAALVVCGTFALVHALPGGPGSIPEDPRVSPAQAARLRAAWGLDRPLGEQFVRFLGAAASGDWGPSLARHRPASEVLAAALPWTLLLAGAALAIELTGGLLLGLAAARRPGGGLDHLLRAVGVTVHSIPDFWLALGLLALLALRWRILPAGGVGTLLEDSPVGPAELLRHLALPALAIGLPAAAGSAQFVRAALVEVAHEPFLLAARARGLTPVRQIVVHQLPVAAAPLLQVAGLSAGTVLSGSLAVEVVFAWPGMGRVVFEALAARDYPVLVAGAGLSAVAVVLASAAAEIAHAALDPRVRDV